MVLKTCTSCSSWKELWKFAYTQSTLSAYMEGGFQKLKPSSIISAHSEVRHQLVLKSWHWLSNQKRCGLDSQPWLPSKPGSHQGPFSWKTLLLIWEIQAMQTAQGLHALGTGRRKLHLPRLQSLCPGGSLSLSLLTFKAIGVCSEMGNGEVEHSVVTALVRGRPTPAPRNNSLLNICFYPLL